MTLSDAQLAQRRAAAAAGGRASGKLRAARLTSEDQKRFRAKVKPESLKKAGRAGYEATLEKYGEDHFGELLAQHRRKNPTAPVKRVRRWLYAWGYNRFDLDAPMGRYFADLWLYDSNVVIEIDGEHWHTNNDHVGFDREAYDAERLRFIVLARRCTVIRLSEKAIMTNGAKDWLRTRLAVLTTLTRTGSHRHFERCHQVNPIAEGARQ